MVQILIHGLLIFAMWYWLRFQRHHSSFVGMHLKLLQYLLQIASLVDSNLLLLLVSRNS